MITERIDPLRDRFQIQDLPHESILYMIEATMKEFKEMIHTDSQISTELTQDLTYLENLSSNSI